MCTIFTKHRTLLLLNIFAIFSLKRNHSCILIAGWNWIIDLNRLLVRTLLVSLSHLFPLIISYFLCQLFLRHTLNAYIPALKFLVSFISV